MIYAVEIGRATPERMENDYKKHLELVSAPETNRHELAELFRRKGYHDVVPEHFHGARLITGPSTSMDRETLQNMFGIDGVFDIYPATIGIANWDGKSGAKYMGLREALRRKTSDGGVMSVVHFPEGSEMRIRLIEDIYKTPHEDIHHAVHLAKGTPRNMSESILEEMFAMYTDVVFGIRTFDDIGEEAVPHLECMSGSEVPPHDRNLILDVVDRLKEMSLYLTPKGIAYMFLKAHTLGYISRQPLKEFQGLSDGLKSGFLKL